jgi:hypothetical protein
MPAILRRPINSTSNGDMPMTERTEFVTLLAAALGGVLANGETYSAKADLVAVAIRNAEDAMQEVNARYRPVTRHAKVEEEKRQFAKRIEQTNGNGHRGHD